MDINQLNSMLKEGLSPLEFEAINDTLINGSNGIKVGDYIQSGLVGKWIIKTKNGYNFGGKNYPSMNIGVICGGGLPPHFLNPEAHRRFVKNIFETSPYNSIGE